MTLFFIPPFLLTPSATAVQLNKSLWGIHSWTRRLPAPLDHWAMISWLGNPAWRWMLSLALFVLIFSLLRWFRYLSCQWLKHLEALRQEKNQLEAAKANVLGEFASPESLAVVSPARYPWGRFLINLLRQTHLWVIAVVAIDIASHVMLMPAWASQSLGKITIVTIGVQMAFWLDQGLVFMLAQVRNNRKSDDERKGFETMMGPLRFVGTLILWSTLTLIILERLGVNVTTLIAGLGIGGVAVALAIQNILGDIFAAFSIVLDKPFIVGDFIVVDTFRGTVDHIGLKTTRLRSLSGEQIIFANADLLKSRISNFRRMEERRVLFTVGVTYMTPPEIIAEIPELIKAIIVAQPDVRFDRAHFSQMAEYALNFEVVYFVLSSDYVTFMDRQQAINLAIFSQFSQRGIEFAFPTRTVYTREP
ncbi:MAG: mechanosensitive ion channel family protein [Vampirovibrionales bacterium]|nr:mechanosensitive ion channel family protein [Vampirovibrionales bacterium]